MSSKEVSEDSDHVHYLVVSSISTRYSLFQYKMLTKLLLNLESKQYCNQMLKY